MRVPGFFMPHGIAGHYNCRAIVEPAWEPPVDYLEISCYNAFMSTVYRVAASHLTREGGGVLCEHMKF